MVESSLEQWVPSPTDPAGAWPPVSVSPMIWTRDAEATLSRRSWRLLKPAIVVLGGPAPMIVSAVLPVTFRSPLELSSLPVRVIESVYVPAPSTMMFDDGSAVPQGVLVPGLSTAMIASRSEQEARVSEVVLTFSVAAAADAAPRSDTHPRASRTAHPASSKRGRIMPRASPASTTARQ